MWNRKLPEETSPDTKKLTLAKAACRNLSLSSQRVRVRILFFGKMIQLELPDLKQVVGLFITLFIRKVLLKRQEPSKVQYSAHARDIRKKNRSYKTQWG